MLDVKPSRTKNEEKNVTQTEIEKLALKLKEHFKSISENL